MPTILALHYWAGAGHEYNQLLPLLPPDTRLLAVAGQVGGQQPGVGRQQGQQLVIFVASAGPI
ncbi:MAG: hypothetical protein EOO56_12640, partial [Hymenobacter sp.]